MCVFALCASGPWNPASIPCALCSLWTRQAFKTPGWSSVSAARPSRTYATTTRRSVCTAFSTSGPSFRSWRDTKRWGHGKRSAPCARRASLCLYPPPSLFDRRALSDVSAPNVCVSTHQMHYPFHLSQAVASQAHVLDLLISGACLRLFCRDQSEVTHKCLWETRPAVPPRCCSLMRELFFFFSSFDFCLTELDHNQTQSSRRI